MLARTTDEKQTGALQKQIKGKLLMADAAKGKELEEASKLEAKKLLDILGSQATVTKLREEHRFTLDVLKKDKSISVQDCVATQKYAKVLYEQGNYTGK